MSSRPQFRSGAIACLVLALVILIALPISAQQEQEKAKIKQKLSMQNIFMAGFFRPQPGNFVWLPDGDAFLFNAQGDWWRFDIASGERTRIVSTSSINAQLMKDRTRREQAGLGDTNSSGRFNRSALTVYPDGSKFLGSMDNDLYIYDVAAQKAKFITDTPEVEQFQSFSPDGARVAYVRGADLWYVDLATGAEHRLTDNGGNAELWNGVADWVYEEELGVRRAFWWAPDSQRIAYLQFDTTPIKPYLIIDHTQIRPEPERQKFPLTGEANSLVKLGIVDLAGTTKWVDTGAETDVYLFDAAWTPNGSALTYHWMNRAQNHLEVRFADPATGASRAVVIEKSDSWVNPTSSALTPATNLVFLPDGGFLWGSERSGFRHIWHYGPDGALVGPVTSGNWQITDIDGVSADGKTVWFTATEVSPLERHLYTIGIDGSGMKRITSEPGVHNTTLSRDGARAITSHSTLTTPPQVRLLAADGAVKAILAESVSTAQKNFDFNFSKLVTVTAEDGETLYGALTLPPGFDETKKYPVIVYLYGGPGHQVVSNAWSGELIIFHQVLAAQGYVVFSLDNRGSPYRGLAFESKIFRNMADWELRDQIAGVQYLRTLPYVDGERVGITGGSYGGYMTLHALFRAPEYFTVGVAQSPGADWKHYDTIYTERYMGTPQNNPEGYKASSPANHASGLKGKLYIQHGMMDNNVHVQQVIQVVDALIMAGKDFKFMLYPQERHGIGNPARSMHAYNTLIAFFNEHLKP